MRVHSYLSPKCHVRESRIDRLGVFAKKPIKKGEIITIWGGAIYSSSEIDSYAIRYPHFRTHPFGVYEGYYMGPVHPKDPIDDAERFNHSCNANAGIKGQIILVARRDISSGEEIFFDYETVETSIDGLDFNCRCGERNCRKKIDGSAWKRSDFVRMNKDCLSWFIQEKLKKQNRKNGK